MAYGCRLWLGVALGCSACVVGQGHGDDKLQYTLSSPRTGSSRDAGSGSAGHAAEPAGTGGAPGGASGSTAAAGARSSDSGGAGLDSGVRGGSTNSGKQDGGGVIDRDAATTTPNDSGVANDSDAECAPGAVDVCNPVTNEGCFDSLSMQCAVDYSSTLTGYCIFYSGQAPTPGVDCLNTGVTESCPPTSTCVDGACRELCFCNADCEAGACCTQPLENTGFKLCGDC